MKTDIIRERLHGIENRIQDRKLKRREIRVEYLERKRTGRVREYQIDREKRA
jgi:hypothetical protein